MKRKFCVMLHRAREIRMVRWRTNVHNIARCSLKLTLSFGIFIARNVECRKKKNEIEGVIYRSWEDPVNRASLCTNSASSD